MIKYYAIKMSFRSTPLMLLFTNMNGAVTHGGRALVINHGHWWILPGMILVQARGPTHVVGLLEVSGVQI